jgi:hypothetical protein
MVNGRFNSSQQVIMSISHNNDYNHTKRRTKRPIPNYIIKNFVGRN